MCSEGGRYFFVIFLNEKVLKMKYFSLNILFFEGLKDFKVVNVYWNKKDGNYMEMFFVRG